MRMLGMFLGLDVKRNVPIKLDDPHPVHRYTDPQYSGIAGLDGYTRLSRADPDRQGSPPFVEGSHGREPMSPDESFEQ